MSTTLYLKEPLWIWAPVVFIVKGVLFEELLKLVNLYFVFVAFLQWWPQTGACRLAALACEIPGTA